ncbi:MAG: cysteine--tRNA ligase [Alphaproteobacteria bacterium]
MNDIFIFNTASNKKEKFIPIDADDVRLYVCGPTVYDDIHIGNARPLIVFDVLSRLLKLKYHHVKYVRNITDIDDKIIHRATEKKIAIDVLVKKTLADFHNLTIKLGCPADSEPRATDHIPDMINMIQILLDKGFAYQTEGHVLFDITQIADYGKFAKKNLKDLISGARIDVAPYKKSPLDFILWKPKKNNEPFFSSPFGDGRPGWHIECSAMAKKHLGQEFDIHAGGQDLIFPHHQNELVQSRACGYGFANYWMHNGFVLINDKKMSKSEGNFITVKNLLEKKRLPPAVLRLLMLSTNYRQPLNFTEKKLDETKDIFNKITNTLITQIDYAKQINKYTVDNQETINNFMIAILGDDLDTISLLKEMHQLITSIHKNKNIKDMSLFFNIARMIIMNANDKMHVFSYDTFDMVTFDNQFNLTKDMTKKINHLIKNRDHAKTIKDFITADNHKEQIAKMGFTIRDRKNTKPIVIDNSLFQ